MAEKIAEFFGELIKNPYITTLIISMIPIIELRLSIPLAMHYYKISIFESVAFSLLGGFLITAVLLLFLRRVFDLLKKTKVFASMVNYFEKKFKKQSDKIEQKAEQKVSENKKKDRDFLKFISVLFFVATPLPGTGVWGGAAVAVFLNMKFRSALLAVTLGNIVAAAIMVCISLLF